MPPSLYPLQEVDRSRISRNEESLEFRLLLILGLEAKKINAIIFLICDICFPISFFLDKNALTD